MVPSPSPHMALSLRVRSQVQHNIETGPLERKANRSWPVLHPQTQNLPSRPQVASIMPSGLNATEVIRPVCPWLM